MPQILGSWENFCGMVSLLRQCGIIEAPRDIWWDVRPSPDLGTVEVRICDIPGRFESIIALVALIQALVAAIARGQIRSPDMHIAIILSNKWQAARHGLDGQFVTQEHFGRIGIREKLLELLEQLEPVFAELGSHDSISVLEKMIRTGPCSELIRNIAAETGDLREAIRHLKSQFWNRSSPSLSRSLI